MDLIPVFLNLSLISTQRPVPAGHPSPISQILTPYTSGTPVDNERTSHNGNSRSDRRDIHSRSWRGKFWALGKAHTHQSYGAVGSKWYIVSIYVYLAGTKSLWSSSFFTAKVRQKFQELYEQLDIPDSIWQTSCFQLFTPCLMLEVESCCLCCVNTTQIEEVTPSKGFYQLPAGSFNAIAIVLN